MDIAMVFDGLSVGGAEKVGAAYAHLLRQMGHTVTIFNLRPEKNEFESQFPQECAIEHLEYLSSQAPDYHVNLAWESPLRRLGYPIVYNGFLARSALRRLLWRRRAALRREYDLAIAFSGHFNDLTVVASGIVRAKNTLCWLHGALYQYILLSHGYINLYNKIKNLVVLVDDAQEEALIYNSKLTANIHKLYNPTFIAAEPVDDAVTEQLRKTYGDFLLMVARFNYPHKDHYTVISALKTLRDRYGETHELVLLGSGPSEDEVKAFAQSLGSDLASHIHFLGDRFDAQNYYSAAHILVHASVAGEGLPTVMLEAMSFGVPMVVTDSKVGPREILRDNEYGLLCRVRDPEDMAAKIHRLYTDHELYRQYREKSGERIRDFQPEAIRSQLDLLLQELSTQ